MKRHLFGVMAVAAMALTLQSQAVRAQDSNPLRWLFGNQDPRLTATGIVVGLGADAGSYALSHKHGIPPTRIASPGFAYGVTAFACAAVYPIVATWVVHRELTPREAYVGIANCVVPIIGGWIVDASLPHTAWNDSTPEPKHHKRRHQ